MNINYFLTSSGKLNTNWKKLIDKDPSQFDRSDFDVKYDDKTVLQLAMHGLMKMPECQTCGNDVKKIGYGYCSAKCSANDPIVKQKQIDNTDIEARGEKISKSLKGRNDYHDKSWETRKEKYGDVGVSENGLEILKSFDRNIEKQRQTCIEKYGVDNVSKSTEIKEKLKQHQLDNSSSQLHLPKWIYDKTKFTEMYNEHGFVGLKNIIGCQNNLMYKLSFEYGLRELSVSVAETEIQSFIKSFGFECEVRTRKIISPLELDIFVPELNLAIEYDGVYWHSSGDTNTDSFIKSKHIHKTNMCESKNIHLLHIFENEWIDKNEIWKSVIRHKLGKSEKIFARKCDIVVITSKEANDFCDANHLQGSCNHSYAYGLVYDGELVQVATFGKPRYTNTNKMELIRLCSKLNHCVVGGASKLLKNKDLISYANRRWSFGNVYEMIGMKKISVTPPCYYYLDGMDMKHRSSYMKHKLPKILKIFDPSKTEAENCYDNGLRRIWDCGNILYST